MEDDHWLTQALKDDNLVVQLLFRLKQSSPPPRPFRWGRRRRRSNPAPVVRKVINEPARCSPSTPLSWSGGSEESRRSSLKSKCAFASTSSMGTTYKKKSPKKQSFGELKDKESQLLKEKVHLKKNLASLRVNMTQQKARKDKLTKLKFCFANKSEKTPSEPVAPLSDQGNRTKSSPIGQALPILQKCAMGDNVVAPPCSSEAQNDADLCESCLNIPDLNAMPMEQEVRKALITQTN